MKVFLFTLYASSCMVVAFISEYAEFNRTNYLIDKKAGSGYVEIIPNKESIEYQILEFRGNEEDVQR